MKVGAVLFALSTSLLLIALYKATPAEAAPSTAAEVMSACDVESVVRMTTRSTMNALVEEFQEYKSGRSEERVREFANALRDEEHSTVEAISATIGGKLSNGIPERALASLTNFCRSDVYRRYISEAPVPLRLQGVFSLPLLSKNVPAHSGEPSRVRVLQLVGGSVQPDLLGKVQVFIENDLGKSALLELSAISEQMYFDAEHNRQGFMILACEAAKTRAIAHLREEGVKL